MNQQMQDHIVEHCGIRAVVFSKKYLGLPSMISRSKNNFFQFIKNRVWKRIQSWKKELLSKGGKEVLIKAVAQAIATYTMSYF